MEVVVYIDIEIFFFVMFWFYDGIKVDYICKKKFKFN